MKRVAFVLLVVLLLGAALPALGASKWYEAYNFGVNQVRTSNFQAGAQALQRAIDEMPQENAAQAVPGQIFTYTPHFWLGIAKLNLGDPDGALHEWKISEDQGAIQNTPYYAQLRDLIGRANSQKQRRGRSDSQQTGSEWRHRPSVVGPGGRGDRRRRSQRDLSRRAAEAGRSEGRECEGGCGCTQLQARRGSG
jgi:hypothetical protein